MLKRAAPTPPPLLRIPRWAALSAVSLRLNGAPGRFSFPSFFRGCAADGRQDHLRANNFATLSADAEGKQPIVAGALRHSHRQTDSFATPPSLQYALAKITCSVDSEPQRM